MADLTSIINITDSRIDSVLYPKSESLKEDCDGIFSNLIVIIFNFS